MGSRCSTPEDKDVEKGLDRRKEARVDRSHSLWANSRATTTVNTASDCGIPRDNCTHLLTSKGPISDDDAPAPTELTTDDETPEPIIVPRTPVLDYANDLFTDSNTVEDYPRGYPLLAAFQSSEPNFSMYRSFDYLHSRVILHMQDELRVLEKRLGKLDHEDLASLSVDANTCVASRDSDVRRARIEGKPSQREALLSEICDKLFLYDKVLRKARGLNAFQRPSERDWKSLRDWFIAEKPLTYEPEGEYILKKEDLITLRQGRELAGFDGWVESWIQYLPKRLGRASCSKPEVHHGRCLQICSGSLPRPNHGPRQETRTYTTSHHSELRGWSVSSSP